ncbi:MAG TPA: ABC transporter substrate-binding protein [Methanocorpusculum sp.]|nr:ABC transporter substrate-binding protein [Methanocorpusculum sp.]
MQKKILMLSAAVLICAAVIFASGCVSSSNSGNTSTNTNGIVEIIYAGCGQMPQLLSAGDVDACIAWQPFVAILEEGQVGKIISYSQDLPPEGMWTDHTCCVFGANDKALQNPELATALTELMILGNKYITEHPNESANAAADWLFGNGDLTYGGVTVKSTAVTAKSIPTIKFSSLVTDPWIQSNLIFVQSQRDLGLVSGTLKSTTDEQTIAALFDFSPYQKAISEIESGKLSTPAEVSDTISIGYLASDHDSPLFVLLKDWQYFKDNYNCYIKPSKEAVGKIEKGDLYMNGEFVAKLKFVEGTAGPLLMTLLQQDQIRYAIAGAPPFISAIDKGDSTIGVKILAPIMMDGSALVASMKSPATDWASFTKWIKDASASGKNLIIADPQLGSIQDVQLKTALESAGIAYKLK